MLFFKTKCRMNDVSPTLCIIHVSAPRMAMNKWNLTNVDWSTVAQNHPWSCRSVATYSRGSQSMNVKALEIIKIKLKRLPQFFQTPFDKQKINTPTFNCIWNSKFLKYCDKKAIRSMEQCVLLVIYNTHLPWTFIEPLWRTKLQTGNWQNRACSLLS